MAKTEVFLTLSGGKKGRMPGVQLLVQSQEKTLSKNNVKSGEKLTVKDTFSLNYQALLA